MDSEEIFTEEVVVLTKCLSTCGECTGRYFSEVLGGRRFVCHCKCHSSGRVSCKTPESKASKDMGDCNIMIPKEEEEEEGRVVARAPNYRLSKCRAQITSSQYSSYLKRRNFILILLLAFQLAAEFWTMTFPISVMLEVSASGSPLNTLGGLP